MRLGERREEDVRQALPDGRESWMIGRLTADPDVMHGAVCVAGTRIPAAMVWGAINRNNYLVETVLYEWPQLTRADVTAALAYETQRREQDVVVECPECGQELTGFHEWRRRLEIVERRLNRMDGAIDQALAGVDRLERPDAPPREWR